MKYIVPHEMPLLEAMSHLSSKSSKTTLREWIKEGRALVDNVPNRIPQSVVSSGQTVTLGPKIRYLEGDIRLLYEDNDLVIIDKPEGLLSVSTDFEHGKTAHAFLKKAYRPKMVHVVHRLDQDTSGVMVFALSEKGKEGLKKLFEEHTLLRQYVAIVEGHFKKKEGSWQSYLYEDQYYKVHSTDNPMIGQDAITHYVVEGTSKKYSRIVATLETGRKNQIRVHCQDAGHPVVGDKKYGSKSNVIKRLALHAYRLEFKHPVTGKYLAFCSEIPESFGRLVKI